MTAIFLLAAIVPGQVPLKATMDNQQGGIESRKEARDKVLAAIGKDALPFTKSFGDLGIEALAACEPETGKGIVRLFTSGDLARLKNQKAALNAIRNNGTPAAAWLVQHHEQLEDPVSLELWCRSPMEFVYDLKDIELETARAKESRQMVTSWTAWANRDGNMGYVVLGALGLVMVILAFRRRKAATS
jgi:hypothetical protein